jgi:hypothetical protein
MKAPTELKGTEGGAVAWSDELAVAEAEAKIKRRAIIRDLLRTVIAAITCVLLAKGMALAAHANEITWLAAFALAACFWCAGMWHWKEIDG